VQQPLWIELSSTESALKFANDVGYPLFVRPSHVFSGAAMNVVWTDDQLRACLEEAADISPEYLLLSLILSKALLKSKWMVLQRTERLSL
jgi:carbamoylphosphate synthase large subunit